MALEQLFLQKMGLAILIGALLGLEREHTKHQEIAGLRTFALISLLGSVTVIVSEQLLKNFILVYIGFVAVAVFAIAMYVTGARRKHVGFTTNISLMLAYIFGAMSGFGLFVETVFLGIIVAILLFSREKAHALISKLTHKEVADLMEFLILLGVVYPLIPGKFDVAGIVFPLQTIWLLIVIISLINFVAFVLSRYLKLRYELEVLSFLGGVINSKATSFLVANSYSENRKLIGVLTSSFLLLNAAMYLRNFLIVMLPNIYSIPVLIIPLLTTLAFFFAFSLNIIGASDSKKLKIDSPFHVAEAVKLGISLLLIFPILDLSQQLGPNFFLLASFFAAIASSTASIASVSTLLATGQIGLHAGVQSILIAHLGSVIGNVVVLHFANGGAIIRKSWKPLLISTLAPIAMYAISLYLL
ncbi:MAG: MgtC/SapB family protein [DPANN group archaeon]|nr:MgtC/SapB family protein [DPANN group archaeon]